MHRYAGLFFFKSLTFRKLVESVAIRKLYKNILHPFLLNHVQMQVWIPAVILWKHSLEFRTVSNYWVYDSKVPVTVLNSDVLSCIMEYKKGRFGKEIMSANIRQNKLFGNYMYHLNWMALILLYVTWSINYFKIYNNIDNIYMFWILYYAFLCTLSFICICNINLFDLLTILFIFLGLDVIAHPRTWIRDICCHTWLEINMIVNKTQLPYYFGFYETCMWT